MFAETARKRVRRRYCIGTTNMVLIDVLGHKAMECTENRVIDVSGIEDMKPEQAWKKLEEADKERDLDDFREVDHATVDLGG